jgi:DNA-binding transcriptional MerR regulator
MTIVNRLIFLILFIICTYSITGLEYIENGINQFDNVKIHNYTGSIGSERYSLAYNINGTDNNIYVDIIKFDDVEHFNSWLGVRKEESDSSLDLDDNIIHVYKDGKYVFWTNNLNYIRISELDDVDDFIGSVGTNDFDFDLIREYLDIYPSDCTKEDCLNSEALEQERQRIASLNEQLEQVNQELQEKRRLIQEENEAKIAIVPPTEQRKNLTTKLETKEDESVSVNSQDNVIRIKGDEADNEPESEKSLEGNDNIITLLTNWLKSKFPNFIR